MDSGFWKMAAASMKVVNNQKGIFAPKMLQLNCGKFISTERLKKPTYAAMNEESVNIEHKSITANCANGFKPMEQGEMIKVCVRQRKAIYRPSVDKWTDLMSNSKDYRKSSAHTTSGTEAKSVTRLPAAVENHSLPVLVSDDSHTFIRHSPETSSVLFRKDGRIGYSAVKNDASNLCSKTKIARMNNLKKESLFQGIQDICCEDTSLHRGIPFHYSSKRVLLNNVPHTIDTTYPCKRIKIRDDITSMHSVGRICQKMFDKHQVPHRQMTTVQSSQNYSDNTSNATSKTANGMQKDKLRSLTSDEIKGRVVHFKEKDKTESSTQRRFLLIDSQGLPYTVVVEDPLSISSSSNSTSTSVSDSTVAGVSKSLTPRKVYKCPVCFRIFEYLSYLQRHSIAHSQQKPHVCKVCGKAFKRTSHLTRHKYTHFGGKPCQCQICERRFRDASELARHQQCHTEEKNY
ncbi:zinc finger protein 524 [Hyla sarda]|uniref:zinc finger protein 524 n=1 Tax=Hyla sarda TaxID=327740 RepID=UPI0024C3A4C9|nr:zinc finger protein 524 [Hyla sarda]XP_056399236.1 zinc finger protein 524 [Hyla sarda]XP_056399238.1 zinc finger protein 524 [Hyla sarda]XP_056399239.1 zinc finger protein 524 [Hyla sarda]XP_056399240.1 zinc finger protein 524 [Hyla sarda]XP_056399241.1 zinc finger protein 524 [Hyla sarda]